MRLLLLWLSLTFSLSCAAQERVALAPAKPLSEEQRTAYRRDFDEGGISQAHDGTQLRYRLMKPVNPPAQPAAMVVVLHGSGGIGTDGYSQLDDLALRFVRAGVRMDYPAYVVVPQFPVRSANYHESAADHLEASLPGPTMPALFELIESLAGFYPIDRSRIYLVGFSMGASTAWQAVLQRPNLFAAAILLAPVPPERAEAARAAQVPLLICHGELDKENPYNADLAMYQAILKARSPKAEVRFRTYAGMGHAIPPDFLDPTQTWWLAWLFSHHHSKLPP
jgi:predicted peptidase